MWGFEAGLISWYRRRTSEVWHLVGQDHIKKESGKGTVYIRFLTFMSGVQYPDLHWKRNQDDK